MRTIYEVQAFEVYLIQPSDYTLSKFKVGLMVDLQNPNIGIFTTPLRQILRTSSPADKISGRF